MFTNAQFVAFPITLEKPAADAEAFIASDERVQCRNKSGATK